MNEETHALIDTTVLDRMLEDAINFAEQIKVCVARFHHVCDTPNSPYLRLAIHGEFMRVSARVMMVIGRLLEWRATFLGEEIAKIVAAEDHEHILGTACSTDIAELHEPLKWLSERSLDLYRRCSRIFGQASIAWAEQEATATVKLYPVLRS
jgi:hypothetical protein